MYNFEAATIYTLGPRFITRSAPGVGAPSSSAATTHHHHVLIVFEHHIVRFVHIQHRYRSELRGHAAGLGHRGGVHGVDERLHDGMVCAVQVIRQRERTLALAVEGVVAVWSHDPVTPTDFREVYVQRTSLADLARLLASVMRSVAFPGCPALVSRQPRLTQLSSGFGSTVFCI